MKKENWEIKKLLFDDSILYKVGSKKDVEKGLKKMGWKFEDILTSIADETGTFDGKFYRYKNTYFVNEWLLWSKLK